MDPFQKKNREAKFETFTALELRYDHMPIFLFDQLDFFESFQPSDFLLYMESYK